MGQQFRHRFPVDTWRLLWLAGITFVVITTFQHFELLSGNIPSSLASVHTDQIAENATDGASSNYELVGNMTRSYGFKSSNADYTHERADDYQKGKDVDANNDFVSEASIVSNKSLEINNYDKDSSPQQVVQPNASSRFVDEDTGRGFPEKNASFRLENTVTSAVKYEFPGEEMVRVNSTMDAVNTTSKRSGPEETERNAFEKNVSFLPETTRNSAGGLAYIVPVLPPEDPSPNISLARDVEYNNATSLADVERNTSAEEKDATPVVDTRGKSGELKNNITSFVDNSPMIPVSYLKKRPEMQISGVVSVSEMNNLLLQSWSSPSMMRPPRWTSAVDRELLRAKSQIENAPIIKNDPVLYDPLYCNVSRFKRSYELMEEMLKVFIYKEGEKPILHQPVIKGIYASEGWFMKLLEASKKFVTKKARNAHLFYLPFSSRNLELKLYVPNSHSHKNLVAYLKNYLDLIAAKHPFWNRTGGADHFLVACHDWAASETEQLMSNCIRALCNADVKEGFVFGKDASLPETMVRTPQNPLRDIGGKPPSQRSILAFFAGGMHGYLRPILLKHWGNNKDPDMKIFSRMPKAKGKMNYIQHMKSSKYCICPRGYEVNSPRIVEAILYECIPVIISDNYVPPFFEVLNWESFAVFVTEKDIPNLKNILLSIPEKRYREMQMRVKKVQQHFLWHARPVKYDLFHMILHSVWYNRVFRMQPG